VEPDDPDEKPPQIGDHDNSEERTFVEQEEMGEGMEKAISVGIIRSMKNKPVWYCLDERPAIGKLQ